MYHTEYMLTEYMYWVEGGIDVSWTSGSGGGVSISLFTCNIQIPQFCCRENNQTDINWQNQSIQD